MRYGGKRGKFQRKKEREAVSQNISYFARKVIYLSLKPSSFAKNLLKNAHKGCLFPRKLGTVGTFVKEFI
ncbi:hypothetical protein FIU87_01020 [Bacillus sp. THAF10]|nr:hypothetical protein FIU87_01020 [Bacillus sp. THAF10]